MKNEHKYIARIAQESNRNLAWKLSFQRRKEQITEYFSDGRYGSKEKSLEAAIERRDELLPTLPAPLSSRDRKTKRNSSGKVGVRFATNVDNRKANEHRYESWAAFWTDENGNRVTVGFSVNKYGYDGAFKLACIAREERLRDRPAIEQKGGLQDVVRER